MLSHDYSNQDLSDHVQQKGVQQEGVQQNRSQHDHFQHDYHRYSEYTAALPPVLPATQTWYASPVSFQPAPQVPLPRPPQGHFMPLHYSTQRSPPTPTTAPNLGMPRLTQPSGARLSTSDLGRDTRGLLDEGFGVRKHARTYFVIGRVFRALWSEPAGVNPSSAGLAAHQDSGAPVFSKIRRFVVVRNAGTHCVAVPISTYGGRGVTKRSVEKWEHCIVHTGRDIPFPTAGEEAEPGQFQKPIRVIPDDPTERLGPTSRLDLGRPYTIEHNIKVKNFGQVHPQSLPDLVSGFRRVTLGSFLRAGDGRLTPPILSPNDISQADAWKGVIKEVVESTSDHEMKDDGTTPSWTDDGVIDGTDNISNESRTHGRRGLMMLNAESSNGDDDEKILRDLVDLDLHPPWPPLSVNGGFMHSQSIDPKLTTRLYPCFYCDKKFQSAGELRKHQFRHTDVPRAHVCTTCEARFQYPKDLQRHRAARHATVSVSCDFCAKSFNRKDNLARHVKRNHADQLPLDAPASTEALPQPIASSRSETSPHQESSELDYTRNYVRGP